VAALLRVLDRDDPYDLPDLSHVLEAEEEMIRIRRQEARADNFELGIGILCLTLGILLIFMLAPRSEAHPPPPVANKNVAADWG
jgi:hypothetical protein